MAFGWFSKKGGDGSKALQKARKFAEQKRWAEALSYYEEALGSEADREEAIAGARKCREELVAWNLAEARAYADGGEPERAREHARLARDLAGEEADLARESQAVVDGLLGAGAAAASAEPAPAPERLFAPSCGCAAPCPEETPAEVDEEAPEALFEFYMESVTPAEREILEPLEEPFREGFLRLQQGEAEAARPLLEAAAQAAPTAPGTHYTLGLLAAVTHDPEAAATHFAKALEVAPDFAPAIHHWADLLREEGEPTRALEVLEPWLGGHPDDAEALLLMASCRFASGGPEEALETLARATALAPPEDVRPPLLRARILRAQDDVEGALEALQGVAARRPDLLEGLVPLGQLLTEKGGAAAERAAEVFKHCYRLDPERGWWHLLRLAEAYLARGWKDRGLEVAQAARRELPEDADAIADWEAVTRRAST